MTATVDTERFARDEIAVDERQHRFGDFNFAAPASQGSGAFHAGELFVRRVLGRDDRTWSNRVYQDLIRRQFEGQCFGR